MLPDSTPPCPACGEPNAAILAWQLVDEEGRELVRCGCGHIFAVESARTNVSELIERAASLQLACRLQFQMFEDLRVQFDRLRRRFQHRRIDPRARAARLPAFLSTGAVER